MKTSLKQTVLAASAVVVVLAAIAVATAIVSRQHGERAGDAARKRHASYLLADELRQSSDDLTRLARTYVVSGGDPRWERQYLEILDIRNGRQPRPRDYGRIYWDFRAVDGAVPPNGETIALLDLMKREGFSDQELAKLAEAKANSDDLVDTETKAMNMVKGLYADADGRYTRRGEPDLATARTLMHDLDYHRAKARIMKPVDEFLAMLDARTAAELDAARAAQARWSMLAAAGVLLLGVVALAAMVVVRRHAARIIGGFDAVATRIANGDLSQAIAIEMAGEEGGVLQRMEDMQRSLRAMVGEIQACAAGVSTASAEISQGNQDLSERTEQQAASLQLAASTMDQLATTVRGNAASAREASQVAEGASAVAARGGEVVEQVVDTIRGIHESSQRISSITSVIDGLAFQTNLLALNAAVEAARAGAQGRGFAVVAGEVRGLAQRSADAAREIKALIGASAERITHGAALADHAGATMREMVAEIRRVDSFMSAIADASREQSQGVEHVCAAVSQIDGATQQNAALVEEAAAASESLRQQASGLLGTVERFRMA